jgi:FAD-dependent oxidoreductase domain-containing protein 1
MASEYDIVIVGAGILGISCAYHLKANNPNKEILVVDRFGDVGQGNTARSNAMFRNTFTSKDNLILSDSSIDFYLAKQEKSGIDLGLRKTGYLWLMDEKQLASNHRHVEAMLNNGIQVKTYSKEDLKRSLPQLVTDFNGSDDNEAGLLKLRNIEGALLGVKCGRLDPEKLCKFYSNSFLEMGGKISFNVKVKSLIAESIEPLGIEGEPFVWQEGRVAGIRVAGEINEEIRAKTVIIAAGVWNNQLLEPLGIDGRVKAKKRQLFTIPTKQNKPLEELMRNKNFNDLGVLPFVILPKSGCFVKSVEEGNEFWVGCEDDFNRPYLNTPDETLENLHAESGYYEKSIYPILRKYFPQFENAKLGQMWAGYYSMNTLDSMPFVFCENEMIIAGGGSGSGIMKGDAMGRIVNAVYQQGERATAKLYGGREYPAEKLSFKRRGVEREEWVI